MHISLSDFWYDFCYWISAASTTMGFSLRTEGYRNVPANGPALLVANHLSFLDPVVVGLAARRQLHYLARRTLFDHFGLGWLIRSLKTVPVNQEGFAREGLKAILDQLQAGHAVVIFPEGNRSPDGKLQEFRPGVHLLIKRVPMAIVPVGIAGTFDAWPRHHKLPTPAPIFLPARSGTVAVSIGPPLDSRPLAEMDRGSAMAALQKAVVSCCLRAEHIRRKA